jgi:hypothetical protein
MKRVALPFVLVVLGTVIVGCESDRSPRSSRPGQTTTTGAEMRAPTGSTDSKELSSPAAATTIVRWSGDERPH